MAEPTFTVLNGYLGRDGIYRVTIKDHPRPYLCDKALDEGASVRLDGGRAVKAS